METDKQLEDLNYNDMSDSILAGIVFNNDYLNYTIRIKGNDIVNSAENAVLNLGESRRLEYVAKDNFVIKYDGKDFYYVIITNENNTKADTYKDTFVPIQIAIDNILIQLLTNGVVDGYTANVGKLSKPGFKYKLDDKENKSNSYIYFPMIAYYLFIGPILHLIFKLIEDKKTGLKEGLISIGINRVVLWLSWIIIYIPIIIITIIGILVLDPVGITGSINKILFFTILFLYALSALEITVILVLLSKSSKFLILLLSLFMLSINIITDYLYTLKVNGDLMIEIIEKTVSFLYSPIGINMAINSVIYESNKYGYIGFFDIFKSKKEFGIYMLFIIIDIICYFFIAVYIDYYSYNFNNKIFGSRFTDKKDDNSLYALDIQEDPFDSECYVQVRKIYKYFKFKRMYMKNNNNNNDGKIGNIFTANKNISFNAYKDEIFAILGHNGAGKTTLIKIMIGLLKPESGEIYYNKLPLSQNKKAIQSQFGICLENNIFINDFTVSDHYKLYSGIKEIDVEMNEVDSWLKDIGLYEKRDCKVQSLNIGQRRKLCVGLAFIGNPKYIFLDEPTAGLDILSRQKMWKFLLKKKHNRVIFITTHDMDEADIIADRKMIMNKGVIRCLGNSIYLKKHFQMKYHLEVETNSPQSVEEIIKYYIPEAEHYHEKTVVEENNELLPSMITSSHIWKLEIDSSPLYSYLIKHLEAEKQKGEILSSFSVSAPRLEELFLQLDKENDELHENETNIEVTSNNHESTNILVNKQIKNNQSKKIKDHGIEVPMRDSIKKHSDLAKAFCIAMNRFKIKRRDILFIGVTIILPFYFGCLIFGNLKTFYSPLYINNYEKHELSSKLYSNQTWNYDKSQSQSIINTLSPNILQQGPTGLDHIDFQRSNELNLNIINKEKSNLFSQEPYISSSFSGELNNKIYNFNIYYNDSMPHTLPSLLNSLSNAIISSNSASMNNTIHVNSHPLPHVNFDKRTIYQSYYLKDNCFFFLQLILFFCASNIVKERSKGLLKHFQLNGISSYCYWLSLFINDYIWFIISCFSLLLSIIVCKYYPLNYFLLLIVIFIQLLFSGVSCILFQYIFTFFFNNKLVVTLILLVINNSPGFLLVNLIPKTYIEIKFSWGYFISSIIIDAIYPCYCFASVFKDGISMGLKYDTFKNGRIQWTDILIKHPNKILIHIIGSILGVILYSAILVLMIKKRNNKRNKKPINEISKMMEEEIEKEIRNKDDDIYYEYKRVKEDDISNKIPIKLVNLIKEYDNLKFKHSKELKEAMNRVQAKYGECHLSHFGKKENVKKKKHIVKTAFKNFNLGINKYECFGLLGPSGSGKTSLLNTLSLTLKQTAGDIIYEGKKINDYKPNEISIGYCPQKNTLWEGLTLSEHIEMFLYIRGCSRKESKYYANQFIEYCRLKPHKNKYPSEMSEGTRRKLNVIIALCCDSPRIMLDEPSIGMDPVSRYYIWETVKATIRENQSSSIISTNSMEEVEHLCHRIGIIVNGQIQCIGSPEHLRMKYGHTYILDVHSNDIERFHHEVVEKCHLFGEGQSYKRNDISQHRVKYEIQYTNTSNISRVFEIMEACRDIYIDKEYLYIDYSYSQTTLDEVFIHFARHQVNSDNNEDYNDDSIVM